LLSRRFTALVRYLLIAALALASFETIAQQVPITRYARFTGNLNFVATGGSLRTESDTGNSCAMGSTSTRALSGVPAGATIVAAYLYWGGSGSAVDATVSFNGSSVTASRTFQAAYDNDGTDLPFFGGFADVTSRITGTVNRNYTFGGLQANTGQPHCSVAAVQGGWGLAVIYGAPSERLRAINVFDGLQYFRGNALTLTATGFRVPSNNIDGRFAVITWEGDPGNSDPLNGSSESLRFNGSLLDDGLVPGGSVPSTQQFDGTVNSQNATNSYGADIDTYNVSSLLAPGATSATTQYSAGGDLVLLAAQIVSVTSEPYVDLSLSKTHAGNFTVGTNATYTLRVSSASGSQQTDFPITVTDTLPAGLSYVSGIGAGWSCGASGQVVTCTHAGPLNAAASLAPITLSVAVGSAAFPSVSNTAQVTTPSNDPDSANNVATDIATVAGSNLSTSIKTVQDLNGGDANPGDTLRYTIVVNETGGIATSGVTVTDQVPSNVSGFSVVNIPAGATNASSGAGTGSNSTGYLNVTGINVPANGSATIVFDVQVAPGMPPGATIVNTASVINPIGVGATPAAPNIIVSQSAMPGAGTKQLYLRDDMGRALYRTPPTSGQGSVNITTSAQTWTLTPALQTPVTLAAGNMPVRLLATRTGGGFLGFLFPNRSVSVSLSSSHHGVLAQVNNVSLNNMPTSGPDEYVMTLNIPAQIQLPEGSTLALTIANESSGLGIAIWPYSAGSTSQVELNSLSVINVDSVQTFNAAYPAGAAASGFDRNVTAYVRAVISDPFGSFDINGANVTILDPSSNTVINNVAMTQVADSGAATRTYQYAFVVPGNAVAGTWTARILAREGTENAITDLGLATFNIVLPTLSVQKVSEVISDPVNAATNPKRIPGSVLRYTITVTNTGQGSIDASTLVITDPLPTDVELCVAAVCGGVLSFTDGTPLSGLGFNYVSNVSYSSAVSGGAPFTYSPSATPAGYDSNIRGIRIAPSGVMNGANGAGSPSLSIRFNVRVR
jgi:uncharacterized repeat protein (TIGR01451 family)